MHRRKSSKEDQDFENAGIPNSSSSKASNPLVPFPKEATGESVDDKPLRSRENSVPTQPVQQPPIPASPASPAQRSFTMSLPPGSPNSNGLTSPYGQVFGHSRNRSTSGGIFYTRPPQSPLARTNSPPLQKHAPQPLPDSPTSSKKPSFGNGVPSSQNYKRHSRIHSRNLSIYFPRPGSLPQTAIDEDGGQEIEYNRRGDIEAPVSIVPSAKKATQLQDPPSRRRLGDGFSFGGQGNGVNGSAPDTSNPPAASSKGTRRGHHHKHSLSHSFFSFIEPGVQQLKPPTLHPDSVYLPSPAPSEKSLSLEAEPLTNEIKSTILPSLPKLACISAVLQFVLGASLWVSGQQSGSIGCTGVGYWVVFDAFGIAIGHILPAYLSLESLRSPMRRPFGNARIETLMQFSQTVFLIFASIYVCKETVEHLLLSAGEGHHHHPGDEIEDIIGISYPNFLIFITMISLIGNCLFYSNHSKLIEVAGHRLPTITSFLPRSRSRNMLIYSLPTSKVAAVLINPFTAAPLSFSSAILAASLFLPPSQHRPFDLLLASVETFITFSVAYPACAVLGTVLLQTSPPRGLPGGRMETFLRVMRELERHPDVLHLPAPHVWQLTPSTVSQRSSSAQSKEALIVTLELHVRQGLDDAQILQLTRWAHDRCKGALSISAREKGSVDESEVTIGIVRG